MSQRKEKSCAIHTEKKQDKKLEEEKKTRASKKPRGFLRSKALILILIEVVRPVHLPGPTLDFYACVGG